MTTAVENVQGALGRAMATRPEGAGFPHLAAVLRGAGVRRNEWHLPSCQSVYLTDLGPVVNQGVPLVDGFASVAAFDSDALVGALRTDQEGESTFEEFLAAAWRAGVVRYVVDLDARTCTYYGWAGERFEESYPEVDINPGSGPDS